jgi:hypothetical protein
MGKIILEFDSIEEAEDAKIALDGSKWKFAMWELDQKLRSIVRYGGYSDEETEFADKLREQLRKILEEYNLNLE